MANKLEIDRNGITVVDGYALYAATLCDQAIIVSVAIEDLRDAFPGHNVADGSGAASLVDRIRSTAQGAIDGGRNPLPVSEARICEDQHKRLALTRDDFR